MQLEVKIGSLAETNVLGVIGSEDANDDENEREKSRRP